MQYKICYSQNVNLSVQCHLKAANNYMFKVYNKVYNSLKTLQKEDEIIN